MFRQIVCDKCQCEISANAFKRHYDKCAGLGKRVTAENKYETINDRAVCPVCSNLYSLRGISAHIRLAHTDNDHRHRKNSKQVWNKGKTKNDDARLAHLGEKLSKSLKGKKKTILWSAETRNKLSLLMSSRLKKGYADGSRKQAGGRCQWFTVNGNNVQGTWEVRAANILQRLKDAGFISDWSHSATRIPYTDENGALRTYVVDFTVTNNDATQYLLEVKGQQTNNDLLKWNEARKYFDLIVWTLDDIIARE